MSEKRIFWEPLVSAGAVVATILGVVIPLFLHLDNRVDQRLVAIQSEMKDFHGRLCAIEERRNK